MNIAKINKNWKSITRWMIAIVLALLITKWIVLWFIPASVQPEHKSSIQTPEVHPVNSVEKVTLNIDMSPLKTRVEKAYISAKKDIIHYVDDQIGLQKGYSNTRLTKEDGFLDWIFGWGTGYNLMYKKIKGSFGSKDNEVNMVSNKFKNEVMNPGIKEMMHRIQQYAENRMDDYRKSTIVMTKDYLDTEIAMLKFKEYRHLVVDEKTIPLSRYLILSASDGFILAEMTGLTGVSLVAGKMVGAKVSTVLGPKMLGLLTTKASAIVAGKVAAFSSLIFAPLVDYLFNEASKEYHYADTRKMFSKMIAEMFLETEKSVKVQLIRALDDVHNTLYSEINTNLTVTGEK